MIGACWVMLCTWTSSHGALWGYFCSTRYQLHSSETWSDDPMVAVRKLPTVMVYKAPATRIHEEHVRELCARPRTQKRASERRETYARRLRGFYTWLATSDHAFRPWGVPRTWPKPVQNRPKPSETVRNRRKSPKLSQNASITGLSSSTKSDCCGCCAPSKFIHSRFTCTAVSNPFHSNFTAVRMAAGLRSGAPRHC